MEARTTDIRDKPTRPNAFMRIMNEAKFRSDGAHFHLRNPWIPLECVQVTSNVPCSRLREMTPVVMVGFKRPSVSTLSFTLLSLLTLVIWVNIPTQTDKALSPMST